MQKCKYTTKKMLFCIRSDRLYQQRIGMHFVGFLHKYYIARAKINIAHSTEVALFSYKM